MWKKRRDILCPTEVGEVVIDSLMDHFEEIFNYDYTAKLEENLDEIESGREDWVHILREFYQGFSRELQQARQEMKNLKKEETLAGLQCEKCGKEMVIRWGRFGRFLACSAYPECKNTKKVVKVSGEIQVHQDTPAHGNCPKCGTTLVLSTPVTDSLSLAVVIQNVGTSTKRALESSARTVAREKSCSENLVVRKSSTDAALIRIASLHSGTDPSRSRVLPVGHGICWSAPPRSQGSSTIATVPNATIRKSWSWFLCSTGFINTVKVIEDVASEVKNREEVDAVALATTNGNEITCYTSARRVGIGPFLLSFSFFLDNAQRHRRRRRFTKSGPSRSPQT